MSGGGGKLTSTYRQVYDWRRSISHDCAPACRHARSEKVINNVSLEKKIRQFLHPTHYLKRISK